MMNRKTSSMPFLLLALVFSGTGCQPAATAETTDDNSREKGGAAVEKPDVDRRNPAANDDESTTQARSIDVGDSDSSVSAPPLEAEYKNDDYGFSIRYPARYVNQNPRRGSWAQTEVFRATPPGRIPLLTVQILYMDDGTPLTELKDTYFDIQIVKSISDVDVASEKEITLPDGTPAYELEIEYRVKGLSLKTLNLWVQKYDRWFWVQATTSAASWARDLAEMKAMLHSFTPPTREPDNLTKYVSFTEDVPMRDNKTLLARVILPGKAGPYPIIFWYTSYASRVQKLNLMGSGDNDALWGPDARANYGFVLVSPRGRHESKDVAYVGSPTEEEDGVDLIEWINKQPWSDKIGMWFGGGSGGTGYRTVAEQPKGLTAIVAQGSPFICVAPHPEDYTRYYPGGVLLEANMKYMDDQWRGSWEGATAHPQWGDWWDEQFAYRKPKAENINVPVLFDNSWYDYNTNYLFRVYEYLKEKSPIGANTKHVIGPWGHNYYGVLKQGDLEYPKAVNADKKYHRKFFDYWLKGINNGLYDEPPIYYYQLGEEAWKSTSTWPLPGTKDTKYYLQSTGKLLTTAPAGKSKGPDTYIYDPKNPSPGIGGPYIWPTNFHPDPVCGPAYQDNEVLADRNDYLVYDTPVLTKDLEMAGTPCIKLHIGCDRPDTDIIIRLCDYDPSAPSGKKTLLMGSIPQRMRYRKSLREEVWMEPGEVYEVDIKMNHLAYTWKKGHQVRIIVSSSAYPLYALNPNNKDHFMWDEGEPLVAEVRVWHDSSHPSHLILPVAGGRLPK
jgi:predicted acyl esterase